MSETTKTILFVLGACGAVAAAWMGKPNTVGVAHPGSIGKPLFEQFEDPDKAKQMEVVEYDEELGQLTSFRVAQKNGAWVIPSHNDYPADAQENLAEAATVLVGLEVINVISDRKKDHATFGVVKPDADKVSLGDDGVGKLIKMKDETGRTLAELIIGKEVQKQAGQRYVRAGDLDRVYTVKIDPSTMSTKFQDWIEQDVLQLQGMDITEMTIRDYSASPQMTQRGQISLNDQQRLEMNVAWNDQDFKWDLKDLRELRGDDLQPTSLLDYEELNKKALDGMKNALDELKIVDVERKPAGLGAGLKAREEFWNDQEGIRSLFEHGFYPVQMPDGAMKLRSSDGELMVRTKGGLHYQFRFGQVAGIEQGSEGSKLNRFVMVTAQLDESAFEKPEPPAGLTAPDASEEEPQGDVEAAETDSEEAGKDEAESGEEEKDALLKEYERALDDYNEQIAQAESRVQGLNYRFADWYYVIPEDEYKKIHLRRSDVVSIAETNAEEGFDMESFRQLEKAGLEEEKAPPEAAPKP